MYNFLIQDPPADVLSLTRPLSLGKQDFKGAATSKTAGREGKLERSGQEAAAASGLAARSAGLHGGDDGVAGGAKRSSGGLFLRRVGLLALFCACLVGSGEAGLFDLRPGQLALFGTTGDGDAGNGRIVDFQWPAGHSTQLATQLATMSASISAAGGVPAGQEAPAFEFGAIPDYLSDQSGEAALASLSGQAQTNPLFHPVSDELHCLALTIYFEARGEPETGKLAVAHVVMNRMMDSRFPDTICRVVQQGGEQVRHRCQFTWWCDGLSDRPKNLRQWEKSKELARTVYWGGNSDPTGGALWYHADYVAPTWAQAFDRTSQIGRHIFYQRPQTSPKLADRRS